MQKKLIMNLLIILITTVAAKVQHEPGTPLPSFGDPIQNITVIKGRDITFTCIVKHLGQYKVGWVKADTKAIQAIHHQVVTHNPRVSVTYRDRTTWNLHIRDVQEDDRGVYMCQVNTDPMIAEMAFLQVVVPPEIVDEESSGETNVEEGLSVSLSCKAKGHPQPRVSWQREGSVKIVLREQAAKKVPMVESEVLNLTKVKRQDMGPYLCIAKNGIPPSVSKRIMLRVNFKPMMEVPVHMFGSPLGNNVTISCKVESSPKSANNWKKSPEEQMIIASGKYDVTEEHEGYYSTIMRLTIRNFTETDVTNYVCSASNSLGSSESTIQVYEIPTPKLNKDDIEAVEVDEGENSVLPGSKDKGTKVSPFNAPGENNRLENLNGHTSGIKNSRQGNDVDRIRDLDVGGKEKHNEATDEGRTNHRADAEAKRNSVFTFFGSGGSSLQGVAWCYSLHTVCLMILWINLRPWNNDL